MEPGTLRVFLLASDLGPTGAARQLALLAVGLAGTRCRVEVGTLGPASTPLADDLRRAGVPVHPVPIRHAIDVRGVRKLRQVVAAANPDVIHAWGPHAARIAGLTLKPPRLVVSAASAPGGGLPGWLTARVLRRADRIITATWAEGDRYRRLGVSGDNLTRISPAVPPAPPPPDRAEFLRSLGLPPAARLVVTAGRVEPSPGLKAAVWAFDMLRYEFTDLHLLVFGGGPDRAGLEAFGRAVAFDDFRVRFPGPRHDLPAILGLAEVVWVLQDRGGLNLALEAMAAGRPVVGWKTAELADIADDGETGFLVYSNERAQVAARTHGLLTDPARGEALGAAGRARAAERFGVRHMVEQHARLYAEVSSGQ